MRFCVMNMHTMLLFLFLIAFLSRHFSFNCPIRDKFFCNTISRRLSYWGNTVQDASCKVSCSTHLYTPDPWYQGRSISLRMHVATFLSNNVTMSASNNEIWLLRCILNNKISLLRCILKQYGVFLFAMSTVFSFIPQVLIFLFNYWTWLMYCYKRCHLWYKVLKYDFFFLWKNPIF